MHMNPQVANDLIVLALMVVGFTAGLILACRFAFKKSVKKTDPYEDITESYEALRNRNRL